MERLDLWRPRNTRRVWMPLSGLITIAVHWYQRTWPCGGDGCRLCDLVPAREVSYFAAAAKVGTEPKKIVLLERSTAVLDEALRQSSLNWQDGIRSLVVTERSEGRSIAIESWYLLQHATTPAVPLSRVAFSVARLFRYPHFPECQTPGQARRAIEAFSRKQQALMLSGPEVVS